MNEKEQTRRMQFKNAARASWQGLDMSTGCEGFPEGSSYIYGYVMGSIDSDSKLQNVLRFLEIFKMKASQDEEFLAEIEKVIQGNS